MYYEWGSGSNTGLVDQGSVCLAFACPMLADSSEGNLIVCRAAELTVRAPPPLMHAWHAILRVRCRKNVGPSPASRSMPWYCVTEYVSSVCVATHHCPPRHVEAFLFNLRVAEVRAWLVIEFASVKGADEQCRSSSMAILLTVCSIFITHSFLLLPGRIAPHALCGLAHTAVRFRAFSRQTHCKNRQTGFFEPRIIDSQQAAQRWPR